ncbi:MAG: PEP-CTERM sorting domain-containing protein [Verrucomicrobia bacterium]|nr:PEP-CTERM sorting domain-containing protein [Verrucomicrobiota bacterium]
MQKIIFSTFICLGLVTGAFAAGSYVENFESYGTLSYSGSSASLNNGAVLYGNNTSAINTFNNGGLWKALRLAQDGTGNTQATYVIGTVENSSTRVNSFTASFDLQLKSPDAAADNLSFDIGKLAGTFPRSTESGLWSSGQTGSMLSVVWDFYDNGSGDYVGTGGNGGIQLFKNGSLVAGSNVNNPATVFGTLGSTFTRFNVRYDEELNGGTLQLNTGGTVGAGNLITGGSNLFTLANLGVNFAAGDQFAFSAWTGGANVDIFIDNVSIQSVPEPSSGALLALGIGGLIALRRRK